MIQRVQTVYMLASVIAILSMHFFWLASFATPEATFSLTSLGLQCATPGFETDLMAWDLFLLLLVMLLLPLITIFLYRKRKLQLRMLIYTAVLDLCYYGLFFYDQDKYATEVLSKITSNHLEVDSNIMMLFMPALSIFCLIMAMRGVIYDIALLNSLDRLR